VARRLDREEAAVKPGERIVMRDGRRGRVVRRKWMRSRFVLVIELEGGGIINYDPQWLRERERVRT
jgi:hypothetical protein